MNVRYHIVIKGAVQGVGFRPFVYHLARELQLVGWVGNDGGGVLIEVEGDRSHLEDFLTRIDPEKPAHSIIQSLEYWVLDPVGYREFEIRTSTRNGQLSALILPDIATCDACREEIFNPVNRHYRYPFTNCTHCGPRYSIIERLPYDRENTSMKKFPMCARCRDEFENPDDRRFHAQPIACPDCGPHLELRDSYGELVAEKDDALRIAAAMVRDGKILALKGLGGFQLIVDATNEKAIRLLRVRKHREEKPFALMSGSLDQIRPFVSLSRSEERLLISPESPIVLLKRKESRDDHSVSLAAGIAPGNPYLGIMLPYTPLHHLLMSDLNTPVVATSGNLSDEPICTDEHEAMNRLGGIAQYYLVHNRPIVRHVDDSVVRVLMGREYVMRRARGYAPLPVASVMNRAEGMVAVGAHLKNTVAVSSGSNIFISQHIGDLETSESFDVFKKVTTDLTTIYDIKPGVMVCDLHPDYLSTQYARQCKGTLHAVQHHYAHIASCMAENRIDGTLLGVAWDGTGYGLDGTVWGGEFLVTNENSFGRVATMRSFMLPGGEIAIREPRRTAVGILFQILGDKISDGRKIPSVKSFTRKELDILLQMMRRKIRSPVTSSVGRLFDAVGSILGIRQISRFEGEAAMEVEFAGYGYDTDEEYELSLRDPARSGEPIVVDWEPWIHGIIEDISRGMTPGLISKKFHNTLAHSITAIAKKIGQQRVVLSGGCFQNTCLLELAVRRLQGAGYRPYWHQRVPPNDGGISLGQIFAVQRAMRKQIVESTFSFSGKNASLSEEITSPVRGIESR